MAGGASLKVVLVKLAPVAVAGVPPAGPSSRRGPPGLSARLASFGSVMLTWTVRFDTVRPVFAIRIVEVERAGLGDELEEPE